MMTLTDNINRAIADFDSIKTAIEDKGVDVGNVPTSQYASKIGDISGDGSGDNKVNLLLKEQIDTIDESFFDGVTALNKSVFAQNTGIELVKFPDGFTGITGGDGFDGCTNIQEIHVPASYVNDVQQCYRGVPNTVIINYRGTLYQWISIPYKSNGIHGQVYINNQPLTSVTIPEGVTVLNSGKLTYNTTVTSIVFANTMTTLDESSIYGNTALTSVTMNEGLTTIKGSLFRDCDNLDYIDFPSTVTSIGTHLTYSHKKANRVYVFRPATPPTLGNYFTTVNGNIIIVPYDSLHAYKTATNWSSKTAIMKGFGTFENGDSLPATTTDGRYSLTWYGSITDIKSGTNPITAGNGNEVYCDVA